MPSITKEQFDKWNSKATNGFKFDVKEYVCWGDKALVRHESLVGGKIAEFKIRYYEEFKSKTNEWGCTYNVTTGGHIPTLEVNVLVPCETPGIYRVLTFEKGKSLGDALPKMKYDVLCKLANDVNVESYIKKMMA